MDAEYILHGLENNLFPANLDHNDNREPWGVGVSVFPNTMLTPAMFNFDHVVQSIITKVLDYVKSFEQGYETIEPQLILNYDNDNYILIVECYNADGSDYLTERHFLSRVSAINFIDAIGANNFYDMIGTRPVVYEQ